MYGMHAKFTVAGCEARVPTVNGSQRRNLFLATATRNARGMRLIRKPRPRRRREKDTRKTKKKKKNRIPEESRHPQTTVMGINPASSFVFPVNAARFRYLPSTLRGSSFREQFHPRQFAGKDSRAKRSSKSIRTYA